VKAYLRTFGCRANQYDTEALRAMILAAGGTVVTTPEEADIAVFNSCAVTSEAEADLRHSVRRTAARNRGLRSVIMGCAAARDMGVLTTLPTVSDVIAGADMPALATALGIDPTLSASRPAHQTGSRALLRIQDGCDEHCTFCATTLARGAHRSRSVAELLEEAQALATHHPEIVVTGVHIGSYGTDCGSSLSELVERLVRTVQRVRFRLSSIEATEVDARLAELFADDPSRLSPHLHAPLQSGADVVLKRMGRHWYTAASYARGVLSIVGGRAVFGLGADVIAGFPGESEDEHAATVALVRELPFTYLHVFPYSPRPGTAAERLGPRVDPGAVKERAAELRAVAEDKNSTYRRVRVGGVADVVVVGDGQKRWGLTEDYLTVTLADPALPRRTRFAARLSSDHADRLIASPS
jgi:threonylcarbamoyladenosine tRNA methylthiotransferase MtaB